MVNKQTATRFAGNDPVRLGESPYRAWGVQNLAKKRKTK